MGAITPDMAIENALLRADDITLLELFAYQSDTYEHRTWDRGRLLGVNEALTSIRSAAMRLEKAGHRVRGYDNMMWRAGDDTLRGTPGMRRLKARLSVFHERLHDQLVAEGIQEWHLARQPQHPAPTSGMSSSGLQAVVRKKQVHIQDLEEKNKYLTINRAELHDQVSGQANEIQRLVWSAGQIEDEHTTQTRIMEDKIAELEEQLRQAKFAAQQILQSAKSIMATSSDGISEAGGAGQIEPHARLGRQAEGQINMAGSTPELTPALTTSHRQESSVASMSTPSSDRSPEIKPTIAIRRALSTARVRTIKMAEDQYRDYNMWCDFRTQPHVYKQEAWDKEKEEIKQRREDERWDCESSDTDGSVLEEEWCEHADPGKKARQEANSTKNQREEEEHQEPVFAETFVSEEEREERQRELTVATSPV